MVNNDLRSLWKCMQGCAWCPNTACALTFAIIKTIPLAALLICNWCWVWSVKNLNLSDCWDQIDATCAADNVVLFLLHCICHAKWSDWLSWWAQQSTAGSLPNPTDALAVTKRGGGGGGVICSPIVLPPLPGWSIVVQYLFHSGLNTLLTGSG